MIQMIDYKNLRTKKLRFIYFISMKTIFEGSKFTFEIINYRYEGVVGNGL